MTDSDIASLFALAQQLEFWARPLMSSIYSDRLRAMRFNVLSETLSFDKIYDFDAFFKVIARPCDSNSRILTMCNQMAIVHDRIYCILSTVLNHKLF